MEAKKQIIQNALDVMYSVGIQKPKIAVLAASETLNPKLQESADAWKLKQMWENGEFTDCYLEGPISIDLALEKESVEINTIGTFAPTMIPAALPPQIVIILPIILTDFH